jgi:iron complex outermembrane recepter protein
MTTVMTTRYCEAPRVQKSILAAAVASTLALGALPAMAEANLVLEEIIVTAQKRAQSVQDVPIAISALSDDFIKNVGAQDAGDLGLYTPGLETRVTQVTQPTYNIRGIETNDFGIGADPAVAVYVDGVYSGRSGASMTAFQDIERVEVLKGPQGTLFGKNAAAGAIHLITQKPGDEFEASVGITAGNYNKRKVDALLNLPLSDSLFLRLNAMTNKRDGYRKNTFTGDDVADENNSGVRAALLWDVSADTEIIIRAEHVDVDQDGQVKYGLLAGSDLYGDVSLNSALAESLTLRGGSFTVNSDLGSVQFTSITAGKHFESSNGYDEDGISDAFLSLSSKNAEDNNFFSQEFRLVSDSDSALRWTLGAMYSREHGKQETHSELTTGLVDRFLLRDPAVAQGIELWNQYIGPIYNITYNAQTAPAGFGWDIVLDPTGANMFNWGTAAAAGRSVLGLPYPEVALGELKSYSTAVYGDMTYSATEQLDVTVGIRYTSDKKDYSLQVPANAFGLGIAFPLVEDKLSRSDDWENVSYRAVLDYTISTDAMIYLSYATGYKAGGFNSTTVTTPFDMEEVDNLELGLKSTWLEGRVRVNASVFSYEYNGLQEVSQVDTDSGLVTFQIRSIDSEADGGELTLSWLATDNLILSANYSVIDSEITRYPLFANETAEQDRTGHPQTSVAENSYALSAQYSILMAAKSEVILRMDYSYVGERETIPINAPTAATQALLDQYEDEIADGYSNLAARITYIHAGGHWRASLYGQNLTDEEYLYSLGGFSASIDAPSSARNTPRLYGLEVNYSF